MHSWNDGAEEDEAEPKMGLRVNQKLDRDPAFYATLSRDDPRSFRAIRSHIARRGNPVNIDSDAEEHGEVNEV